MAAPWSFSKPGTPDSSSSWLRSCSFTTVVEPYWGLISWGLENGHQRPWVGRYVVRPYSHRERQMYRSVQKFTTSCTSYFELSKSRFLPLFSNNFAMSFEQKRRVDGLLVDYDPPEWVKDLDNVPKYRIKLVHPDTPVQRWYLPGIPDDFELYIKRDDMTGSQLSGNKVRKLEFILADAVSKGCSTIISCGGIQSNHSRATCISARLLGLKTHLLLKSRELDPQKVSCKGNVLLDRLVGAQIHLVPNDAIYSQDIKERADILTKKLMDENGEKAYFIPCGGSNSLGLFGYVQSFQELMKQGVPETFTDIAVAVGSGGTIAGLSVSNHLTKSNLKIHGMAVGDQAKFFHSACNRILSGVGWGDKHPGLWSEELCEIYGEAAGRGYALSTPEELEFIFDVAETTGIILDPVYTGKAAYYLVKLMKEKPENFRGKKILFVHTGGIFSVFEGRMEELMLKRGTTNKIDSWEDVENPPNL